MKVSDNKTHFDFPVDVFPFSSKDLLIGDILDDSKYIVYIFEII